MAAAFLDEVDLEALAENDLRVGMSVVLEIDDFQPSEVLEIDGVQPSEELEIGGVRPSDELEIDGVHPSEEFEIGDVRTLNAAPFRRVLYGSKILLFLFRLDKQILEALNGSHMHSTVDVLFAVDIRHVSIFLRNVRHVLLIYFDRRDNGLPFFFFRLSLDRSFAALILRAWREAVMELGIFF